jgi:MFS family permease
MVGGLLADKFDRKRFLIVLSIEQLVFSLGVAGSCGPRTPPTSCWCVMVLMVGVGSAMFGPAYSAMLPGLVGGRTCPAPSR